MFTVGANRYIASSFALPAQIGHRNGFSLATVIHSGSDQPISKSFLQNIIEKYTTMDDVFCSEFLQGVIFTTSSDKSRKDLISDEADALLKSFKNEWVDVLCEKNPVPPPGVYVATEGTLFEAYKLYEDSYGAFLTSVMRTNAGAHVPLSPAGTGSASSLVAVPTRIRKDFESKNSLQGLRIAVKGNFHIRGLRTSACNLAYFNTYAPQSQTAKSISKLEDGGARVIGVTKLAAFAATEEPIECVDYQAPWNPRGDMYQSPAGSSSGSGAAIASYDWLDIGIGTDTSGSGRRPAHWNGCFAHRPTHGLVDLEGIIPSFSQFDTATIFARGVHQCEDFVSAWYGDKLSQKSPELPFKIIVPEDYMRLITNKDQLTLINNFVNDLESFLEISKVQISLEDTWNKSPPKAANGQSFADYMKYAARDAFFYDDYHHLDSFRSDYLSKFSKSPYVSPPLRWQWDLSATISRSDRDEAVHRLAVYKDWFLSEIMEVNKRRPIIIIPIENIAPRYRDEAKTSFDPRGVPMLFLSPISGGPESTVPIGQVQYMSRVSGRSEPQPIAVSLLSLPGADLDLLRLIAGCLQKSGRPTEVQVGRSMF